MAKRADGVPNGLTSAMAAKTCHFGSVGKADDRKGPVGRRKYWYFCFPLQLFLLVFDREMQFTAIVFVALNSKAENV